MVRRIEVDTPVKPYPAAPKGKREKPGFYAGVATESRAVVDKGDDYDVQNKTADLVKDQPFAAVKCFN